MQKIKPIAAFHFGNFWSSFSSVFGKLTFKFWPSQVDTGADEISRQCYSLISGFKTEVGQAEGNVSTREHLKEVAKGLEK